jgi:enamine deaminase RidA (YjgF/YER057c/UK114 family)
VNASQSWRAQFEITPPALHIAAAATHCTPVDTFAAVSEPGSVRRHASEAPWEPVVGYSRTVEAGPFVFVAGTTATSEGQVVAEGDAYGQTIQALRNVESALQLAGAQLADVVQTRLFLIDVTHWQEVGRAHAEVFAGMFPVTALVEVARLIDPRMLVEIEAVAYRQPGSR